MRLILIAHRILIGTAVGFGVFYSIWEFRAYRESGELSHALIALVAAVLTVGLGYYLKNLKRFIG
jgi:hypothetical protein